MADLRATPMVNPVMGLLADRLKKVQQFGAKPFGYENPPVEMLMNLLGVPAVQQTMERMAYGEPLTTGRGMTTKPRAEAVEATMAVAPVAGLLGKTTKGLPVGASVKNIAKVDELTGLPLNADGTVTVYHHTNKKAADQITSSKKLKSAGEPDVYVTTEKEPNTGYGDTVVPIRINPEKLILDDEFPSGRMDFRIPSGKSGVSIKLEPKPSYPQQEALDTAQRNAALPIEEGGLGLPKDNTPEMRAKAMGFDVDAYHGTDIDDISKFNLRKSRRGEGVSVALSPENAQSYGSIIYPLKINNQKVFDPADKNQFNELQTYVVDLLGKQKPYDKNAVSFYPFTSKKVFENLDNPETGAYYLENKLISESLKDLGYSGSSGMEAGQSQLKIFNPENIRSRFAAFDPMRRNEADILAGVLPLGLLADEEQRKKIYELMPSLLGQ